MLHRFLEGTSPVVALRSVGAAVASSTLTAIAGFASLFAASHNGLKSMGLVACGTPQEPPAPVESISSEPLAPESQPESSAVVSEPPQSQVSSSVSSAVGSNPDDVFTWFAGYRMNQFAEQGLIEVEREEAVDGRLRRYYRLTDAGAAALAGQVERLRRHAGAAEARLKLRTT